MKNTILKGILALIFGWVVVPVMGQDCLEIYFKDGNLQKFYLEGVKEIVTSSYDEVGIQHGENEYQHIVTNYNTYIYPLNDISYISFTKYDKELAKQNFHSAISEVLPTLSECETIEDAEAKLNEIKNSKGVEDAWSDGNDLYVKVDKWETISFHFSHNDNDESYSSASKMKSYMPKLKELAAGMNGKLSIVIANQQDKDQGRKRNKELLLSFRDELLSRGFDATYEENPTLKDFFESKMYDYDVVFLVTHGNYKNGLHYIISADEIGKVIKLNSDISQATSDKWFDATEEYLLKTKYLGTQTISFAYVDEIRTVPHWVGYIQISEGFFDNIWLGGLSEGNFGTNSIFFNGACHSMDGNEQNWHSFADKLIENHGLALYLGYSKTNYYSQEAGCEYFRSLFQGTSIDKALSGLPQSYRVESNKEGAILHQWPQKTSRNFFLFPTVTKQIEQTTAQTAFNRFGYVEVEGYATVLDPEADDAVEMGFQYDTDEYFSSPTTVTSTDVIKLTNLLDNGKGNVQFRGQLTNLKLDNTYYYRAYTYDGMDYNYSEPCLFTIEAAPVYPDLQLSQTQLSIVAGGNTTVEITSGSGSYSIEKIEPEGVASASISENHISIEALTAGTAIITVKDDKSGERAPIEVTVTENTAPVAYLTCPDDHHPHLIDLGLPSGTKWACCNVDDEHPDNQSPTNYGGYYAWGEVKEKDYYDWSTYIHCDGSSSTGHDLGGDIAGTEYDVAHVQWGESWVMPSLDQIMELLDNCTFTWTTLNGVNGGQFSGSNGGSIFLPSAGVLWTEEHVFDYNGAYWSSSPTIYYPKVLGYADIFWFDSDEVGRGPLEGYWGLTVRPVWAP